MAPQELSLFCCPFFSSAHPGFSSSPYFFYFFLLPTIPGLVFDLVHVGNISNGEGLSLSNYFDYLRRLFANRRNGALTMPFLLRNPSCACDPGLPPAIVKEAEC